MRKFLLAGVLALATAPASANIIAALGTDPTSSTGAFSHSPPRSAAFDDEYTFLLSHSGNLTIASLTNVFPTSADFISNFTAGVFAGTPALPGAEVLGPDHATLGCGLIAQCQSISGAAILSAGSYFLEVSGIDGATSGYGGNIATFAVPTPIAGAGIPGVLAGLGLLALAMMRRHRDVAAS